MVEAQIASRRSVDREVIKAATGDGKMRAVPAEVEESLSKRGRPYKASPSRNLSLSRSRTQTIAIALTKVREKDYERHFLLTNQHELLAY